MCLRKRLLRAQIWITQCHRWQFGAVGSDVGKINEVTLRQARLVGMGDRIGIRLQVQEIYLSLTNHPGQLSTKFIF